MSDDTVDTRATRTTCGYHRGVGHWTCQVICARAAWDMVMDYKHGTLREVQHTERCVKILDAVPDAVPHEMWKWLYGQAAEGGEVTVPYYCRDEWFCHTHLLIDYACQKYPQAFSKK